MPTTPAQRCPRRSTGPAARCCCDGAHAQLRVHGEPARVDPQIATALLRTARGALANVAEHAQAHTAVVTLTYQEASVSLDVRDDGVGFTLADSPRSGRPGRGNGLAGIRARVARHDGQLVVESAPGEGTAVAASFPLTEADDGLRGR